VAFVYICDDLDDKLDMICVLMSTNCAFYVCADIQQNDKNPSCQIYSWKDGKRQVVRYALGNFVRSLQVFAIFNLCPCLVLIFFCEKLAFCGHLDVDVYLINF